MREFLEAMVESSIKVVNDLGDEGRVNIPAQAGKRTCKAEKAVHDNFLKCLERKFEKDFYLLGEGFKDVGNPNSQNKFTLDALDGTVYYVRQKSKSPFAIAIAASAILSKNPQFTYNDVIAGAVGDITTKEIWSASKEIAKSSLCGPIRTGGNESHTPVILFDFYFPSDAEARLKLEKFRESKGRWFDSLNPGSAAEHMAKVACGEADAAVTIGGLSDCEALPGYILVKSAGGYVLSVKTGRELGPETFEPGKKVPVIAAKDEEFARELYEEITS